MLYYPHTLQVENSITTHLNLAQPHHNALVRFLLTPTSLVSSQLLPIGQHQIQPQLLRHLVVHHTLRCPRVHDRQSQLPLHYYLGNVLGAIPGEHHPLIGEPKCPLRSCGEAIPLNDLEVRAGSCGNGGVDGGGVDGAYGVGAIGSLGRSRS